MLSIVIDLDKLSTNCRKKIPDIDNSVALNELIKAEIFNIFSEYFSDFSYSSSAEREKAIKWAAKKISLIKLVYGEKSESYKMSINEFTSMLISRFESDQSFSELEKDFQKKREYKAELSDALKQKAYYEKCLDAITSAEATLKSSFGNLSEKKEIIDFAKDIQINDEFPPEIKKTLNSVKNLCDPSNSLTSGILLMAKFKESSSNKSVDELINELEKLDKVLVGDDVGKLEKAIFKKFLIDSLCEIILPARKLCFDYSPYTSKGLSEKYVKLSELSKKTIDASNKLYNIYILNEEKLLNNSSFDRISSAEWPMIKRDFDHLELKNEFELLKSKKYIANEVFQYISSFIFLLKKINGALYSAEDSISNYKIWEMSCYLPFPGKSDKLNVAREKIKSAEDKLINFKNLYAECSEYLVSKDYIQSPNHAKILNDLITFLYDYKKLTIGGVEMKEAYLNPLMADTSDIDEESLKRVELLLEMSASVNHQGVSILHT